MHAKNHRGVLIPTPCATMLVGHGTIFVPWWAFVFALVTRWQEIVNAWSFRFPSVIKLHTGLVVSCLGRLAGWWVGKTKQKLTPN